MSTNSTLRRLKRIGAAPQAESASDLHTELVLLREENQRLRAAGDAAPDLATMLERIRRVPSPPGEDPVDEAAAMLVQDMVIRESLVEICRMLRRTSTELEAQLLRVEVDA
jgi:hypothetical protein